MRQASMKLTMAVILCGGLAACGDSPGERALTGGAIGAGTGAIIGGVAGGPATGALIGGAVGAVGGAATTRRQVDLGPAP
ncbi:MAG: YMGG-like glycine zipper-containing protein [Rhodospirillales bacterium]